MSNEDSPVPRDPAEAAIMTEADVARWLERVGAPAEVQQAVTSSLRNGTDAIVALPGGEEVRFFTSAPGLYCAKVSGAATERAKP